MLDTSQLPEILFIVGPQIKDPSLTTFADSNGNTVVPIWTERELCLKANAHSNNTVNVCSIESHYVLGGLLGGHRQGEWYLLIDPLIDQMRILEGNFLTFDFTGLRYLRLKDFNAIWPTIRLLWLRTGGDEGGVILLKYFGEKHPELFGIEILNEFVQWLKKLKNAPMSSEYIYACSLVQGGTLARKLGLTFKIPGSEESFSLRERSAIPKVVQREVWRRDQGRCVACGSQENLEFDHIIPVTKGGSNTTRNIQLLCEPCNRRKSDSDPGNW